MPLANRLCAGCKYQRVVLEVEFNLLFRCSTSRFDVIGEAQS